MPVKSTVRVGYILIATIIVLYVTEAAELCQLAFTTEPRAPGLPETRPTFVKIADKPISVFYDDADVIKAQFIDNSGPSKQIAPRATKDMMTFGVSSFKDDTSIYLTYLDRPRLGVGMAVSGFPFDSPEILPTHIVPDVSPTDNPAPVSVAAYSDFVAFAWIGGSSANSDTTLQLSRSTDAGGSFDNIKLNGVNPTWTAMTFVQQIDMYGTPTFLGVYQEQPGETSLFRVSAEYIDGVVIEVKNQFVVGGDTLTHLSIAAYNKQKNFAISGQVTSSEGVPKAVYVATFDAALGFVNSKTFETFAKPSLYITEFDELYLSYLTPYNTTCIEVYEDLDFKVLTMSWCTQKYPVAPSWSGLTAETIGAFMAISVEREARSEIEVYKCNFGCGNGVVSVVRNEQCETGGLGCDSNCACKSGNSPLSPPSLNCLVPPPPPVPSVPVAVATPTGSLPVVKPILDCNARVNQTHYRSYLSYETVTQGVAAVSVSIGERNRFTTIAPNQGQPTIFLAGRSAVFNTSVDISVGQSVQWILTSYNLGIVEAESNRCPTDITFNIGIISTTPPSETFINATIDYVAWVFNVSSNNVSINVTQGAQENTFDLNVTVQVTVDALIDAIEEIRNITEDTTSFEEHIKEISPDVSVTEVRGRPTGVDNPATFVAEPIASPNSGSSLLASGSLIALLLVPLL
eukprot:TRINITY_DN5454_c0_g1_i1.p1 TRINITY_DN5454_c0_g1~~TRINITY_DN5454_c0_g1_i1.p1  ORF type:complete len:703 (+),score=109.30 TRINITY_DN5454_c0_g1_i1:53-2110(+)